MNKVRKLIIAGISVLLLSFPVHAQETAPVQPGQGSVQEEAFPESVEDQAVPEDIDVRVAAEGVDARTAAKGGESSPGHHPEQGPPEQGGAKAEARRAAAKEQTKGLDEQVQEIKADVLSIATELNRLEEKLLYPSDTQVAIFVSLEGNEKFRLDAVTIELDGKKVAQHLYTFNEIEALKKGGVQRIHVGNVMTGEHPLHVTVLGKTESGADFQREENFKVAKGIGPKLVGVVLAGGKTITVKDW
ncbi:hypothetical protein KP003_17355 [Geomonas nitrogeniifigens]|uniref:hypothetical protein n=1 Tax=Geomonas diazotrophica TaxID=2843197 RepID=UPI001C2C9569|nr:hypothetical protein [Geomonas nitrogeniifigens]QXE86109.1 hypothetical protein KP003_17355 [Geomonas nitrogeniifigens]